MNDKIDTFYQTLLSQYAFLNLYNGIAPSSSGYMAGGNFVLLFSNFLAFTKISKRGWNTDFEFIGIWNDLFTIVFFICTVLSSLIQISVSRYEELTSTFDENDNIAVIFIALVPISIILIGNFIISFLYGKESGFIQKDLRRQEIAKNLDGKVEQVKNKDGKDKTA